MAQVTHKEMNLSTLFRLLFVVTIVFSFASSSGPGRSENHACAQDYSFSGGISRRVLENYLSRAITMSDMFLEQGDLDDNIRMLSDIGAKFAGRTVFLWAGEARLPNILTNARNDILKVHNVDPEMILQAAIFGKKQE